MEKVKNTYYISVARGEILRSGTDSPYEFVVHATDGEITELRLLFDAAAKVGWDGFLRAHVPYVQYHDDEPNQQSDTLLTQAYSYIHKIGNEEAVKHIESMGVLSPTKEHPYLSVEGDHSQEENEPLN